MDENSETPANATFKVAGVVPSIQFWQGSPGVSPLELLESLPPPDESLSESEPLWEFDCESEESLAELALSED